MKRGQFFLIATIIILGVLVGIGIVYNLATSPPDDVAVFDLSSEIQHESLQVIDSSVYADEDQDTIVQKVENLLGNYSEHNPYKEIYIIFRSGDIISTVSYTEEETGNVGIGIGSGPEHNFENIGRGRDSFNLPEGSRSVIISLREGVEREFEIREGENFYVIVSRDRDHERTIIEN